MQKFKGVLLVVSGPSGVGKGSICKAVMSRNPMISESVSATTRSRRNDEVEGVNYFFKTREEFTKMIEAGEFLEHMSLFGTHKYGTPKGYVEGQIEAGADVLLEIDYHGALSVKAAYPQAILVFVAPPSFSELKSRLIHRNTESIESIDERLVVASEEMSVIDKFDYIIINDVLDKAVSRLEGIVVSEKLKVCRNADLIESLQSQGGV